MERKKNGNKQNGIENNIDRLSTMKHQPKHLRCLLNVSNFFLTETRTPRNISAVPY